MTTRKVLQVAGWLGAVLSVVDKFNTIPQRLHTERPDRI